jgi:GTP-binding protein Era
MAEEKNGTFKSGFVAIIGRPNAGKSTLLNSLLGEKVAIVADKPQTTRNRIVGIKNSADGQIIFLDTPGIHKARSRLNQSMVRIALATYNEVDAVCLLVAVDHPNHEDNDMILETLQEVRKPVLLVLNKIDLIVKSELLPIMDRYAKRRKFDQIIPISATRGDGVDLLVRDLLRILPAGPPLFPQDLYTDMPERFFVAELIREKVIHLTREEVPYATAVEIEAFEEREGKNLIVIKAAIQVERDSQKGILIGKRGQMLKEIGRQAREDMEAMLGARVFLELWVKVEKDWREDPRELRRLGY